VTREGAEKDGKIDFDLAGKLAGNWFHESLPLSQSARGDPKNSAKQLAFVYDVREPKAVRISIGGTVGPAGLYAVQPGAPDPASVTAESGLVKYQIHQALSPGEARKATSENRPAVKKNLLIVQLIGEHKLKVEYFPAELDVEPNGFTSAAAIYER